MKVLFWNTYNNRNINPTICDLISENGVSLVILAEYSDSIDDLIRILNDKGIVMFAYPAPGCERIAVLGEQMDISPGTQTEYSSFQIINNKDIFCCIHLPSQIYSNSEGMREVVIRSILTDITSTEKELQSDNTIIVGDLNIIPFDNMCIDAQFFHGLPVFETSKKKKRMIAGKEFKMFYNPMWRFFGDETKPYGTYYHTTNNTRNIYWHIYDQVIIRPSLKDRFVSSSLQIVTETETQHLINKLGHPDKRISDHLPIIFEIQEENNGQET